MAYSRSPPQSPQEDWMARGLQSVKTFSTSSSRSYGSRSQSYASNRAYSSAHYENTARIYYMELSSYLKELIDQESMEGPQPQRIGARQKLSRLTNSQFHELAMDVYDEAVRRRKNDKFVPFLPVKEDFHPKRNQARQKLATLPESKFKDLASDVHSELARRYMHQDHDDYLPPVPQVPSLDPKMFEKGQTKPGKSTHIVPVKGMMNIESFSDDDETILNSPSKSYSDPKESFGGSRSIASTLNDYTSNDGIEKVRSEYEYQINIMKNRIKHLEEKTQSGMDSIDRELLEQLQKKEQEDQKIISQMEEQYKRLDIKYQKIKEDYHQQQDAVCEVKRETKDMLGELKRLAKLNEKLMVERESTDNTIQDLKIQIKDWQTKYEKTRIELRSVKAYPVDNRKSNDFIKESFLQPQKNGVINYDHILTFQTCIDDLLSTARSNNQINVIQVMKTIVTICKSITKQVETSETQLSSDTTYTLYELKTRFSTALSDLLVAAKHHASGMGISPVSLLDSSAGHLTAVVVDLAKLVGMKENETESYPLSYNTDDRPPISLLRSQLNNDSDTSDSSFDQQGYPSPSEVAVKK
ncbi:unnamed protein product [Rhizopus stolonifer]